MTRLTKKYIFTCKLSGKPIEVDSKSLCYKEILQLLVETNVWKKDPIGTNKFWNEYAFTILYPIRMIDCDNTPNLLLKDYHHTVCL